MYTVYVHINKTNNKKYVGITSCPVKTRWKNGYGYSKELPIGRAIAKYGWDGFEHIILYENMTEDEAKEKEVELIKRWQTQNDTYGYNICAGGNGVVGWHPSDETRRKISEAAKNRCGEKNPNHGHRWTEEARKKAAVKHMRDNLSDETLKRMSDAAIGRNGANNPFYGCHHTEQVRQFLSQLRMRPVNQYTKDGVLIKRHRSIKDAAKDTCGSRVGISNCCRGKTCSSGGFRWRYAE